ncbi:phycobiliprotein lyase [Calothrix sp. NIES-3974]|uniref:phycobiliprotein lyase n=1 Tax=Calothrix sp. NIES-3974 TaxID=2005462 RepID=UPI000B5FDAB1|nr:phycobiliprotein lyase [Calothrix sp. NIES-3974]BAZ05111.1 putative phycoerythrin-associated linker protein, CpeS [Calothrix sp. NIES-3974]
MQVTEFFQMSYGKWRSQRSGHHLAFAHFEQIVSTINITPLEPSDPAVIAVCQTYAVDPQSIIHPFRMEWEGESDWDESTVSGNTVLVPVPDPNQPTRGKLLREQGYAEAIAAIGEYQITEDGTFVLKTNYDRAAAEERIWFVTPNLRFRVATIKTSDGKGVTTASFASEIRSLSGN